MYSSNAIIDNDIKKYKIGRIGVAKIIKDIKNGI